MAILCPLAAGIAPAHAWTMAFSETQNSPNLALEVEASRPESSVRIRGADPLDPIYTGWSLAARPEAVRRLHINEPGSDQRARFSSFIDYQRIDLVDMDAAVAGHLLELELNVRSRVGMPVLGDAKWLDMRPRDAEGRVLTWEALKRVKTWLGGSGATMIVASLSAQVSEPATLALLLSGLLSLIVLHRRRTVVR